MTRSELNNIRSRVSGMTKQAELSHLVLTLLDEVEHDRAREHQLRADYAALLEAARAAVAAATLRERDPTSHLEHELGRRGLLPPPSMSPHEALADAAGLGDILRPGVTTRQAKTTRTGASASRKADSGKADSGKAKRPGVWLRNALSS